MEHSPKPPSFSAFPGSLQQFLAFPESSKIVLGARRSNARLIKDCDDMGPDVCTVEGRRKMEFSMYLDIASRFLRPEDALISLADVPESPGRKRLSKMVDRTWRWFDQTLKKGIKCKLYASIPPVPKEYLANYMDFVKNNIEHVTALVFYNCNLISESFGELDKLPRVLIPPLQSPNAYLKLSQSIPAPMLAVTNDFVTHATDMGLALSSMEFLVANKRQGEEKEAVVGKEWQQQQKKKPLALDLWDPVYSNAQESLMEECKCHTCQTYSRAYICHLLNAKEMTAWVLLQIHNFYTWDKFIQNFNENEDSIQDVINYFAESYQDSLPEQSANRGPRQKGYQSFMGRPETAPENSKSYTMHSKVTI